MHISDKLIKKINENKYVKKTRRGVVSLIFSRIGLFAFLILAQLFMMFYIYYNIRLGLTFTLTGATLIRFILMLVILNVEGVSSANKNAWFLLIAILPFFAVAVFILSHYGIGYRMEQKKVVKTYHESQKYVESNDSLYKQIKKEDPSFYKIAKYLKDYGNFPAFKETSANYYKVGDDMYEAMMKDIKNAQDFIFMEFFILDYGFMWGNILEELVKKVNQGVKVRLIIDGTNLITRVKSDFADQMESMGIECRIFSKMYPIVSTYLNNRDHRKIMVVDGKSAFTGGINLADEYINVYERFGHWKDCGIRLEGSAVKSFTIMFLSMWNAIVDEAEDYTPFLKTYPKQDCEGSYVPFSDNPLDDEDLSKRILMDLIYGSKSYLYLMTPYLIVDEEILNGLKFASKRGVDVRICLPHVPDKKVAFALAKDNYKQLLKAGIRIIEYTPGFSHSKVWLSDGNKAMVGTVNIDYRALFHNFECGVLMDDSNAIGQIEKDFQIFFQVGSEVKKEDAENINLSYRLLAKIAKPFSVLM
ncbi:MAG: phospholipase D-like domain-containing protein [Anaerococcus sp.]|nr:phospholipase D-like domain-containing protein [Anaerococcus sp.]